MMVEFKGLTYYHTLVNNILKWVSSAPSESICDYLNSYTYSFTDYHMLVKFKGLT